MRLYPAAWRKRYGREFAALLEDVQPGWRELWDILRGAMTMQLTAGSWRRTAAAFALLGTIVALVVAFRMPDNYVSTAVLRLDAADSSKAWDDRLVRAEVAVFSRTSLVEVVMQEDLYRSERRQLPLEDIVQNMRNHAVRITPVAGGRPGAPTGFVVAFQYPDRAKAQAVTRDLVAKFQKQLPAHIEVLDPASLPQKPESPARSLIIAAGLLAGLAVGFVVLGIRRWPLVAASGAAVALVALGVTFSLPQTWISTAVVRIDSENPSVLIQAAMSDSKLQRIIQKPGYDLYRDLRITPLHASPKSANAFAISFRYEEPAKAQAVVRELVARLAETNVTAPETMTVLDPASFPQAPAGPNRLVLALLGLGLGMAGRAAYEFRAIRLSLSR
jgi:uncharacterized protein involved in exopolysaccharide biosynthesis